jgi:Fe2+ or Zn2+ uptake regulation protein
MLKNTAQSKFIKEYLERSKTHPSAEEIYQEAVKVLPYITRATVYNVLNRLVKAGKARELNIKKGLTVYEGNLIPHAHLYCTSCGQVIDVEIDGFESFARSLVRSFQAEAVDLILYGKCDSCSLKKLNSGR